MKKSEVIYNQIEHEIIEGIIPANSFIDTPALVKKFNVSVTPVRDALQALCEQGLLISYPRRGYMVNSVTSEDVNHIQALRRNIESYCVAAAIDHATDKEINTLRQYTTKESNSLLPQRTNNMQFHMRIAELSGNPYAAETLRPLISKISLFGARFASDFESYNNIIDAMLKRDKALAIRCIELDIHDI